MDPIGLRAGDNSFFGFRPILNRYTDNPGSCCCDCGDFVDFTRRVFSIFFAVITFPLQIVWRGISLLLEIDPECCAMPNGDRILYDPDGRVVNQPQDRPRPPTPLRLDTATAQGSAALDLPADIIQILINIGKDPRTFRAKMTELGIQNDTEVFEAMRQDATGSLIFTLLPDGVGDIAPSTPNTVLARFNPEYFQLNPGHFRVVAGADIPDAGTSINVVGFNDLLDELEAAGKLTNLKEDGHPVSSYQFVTRFKERITEFATSRSVGGYGMSAEYIAKARNAMRHIIAYFRRQKSTYEAYGLGSSEYTRGQTLYLNQLNRVVRELGARFFHCVNGVSTCLQDHYYDLIANDPSIMERLTFDNKAQRVLMNLRKAAFDLSILNNCGNADVASTTNYYYRAFAAQFGVPSDLSRNDSNHNSIAVRGLDTHLRAAFGENLTGGTHYNVKTIVDDLRTRFQNPKETVVPSQEFTIWYRLNLPTGVTEADILNDDYMTYRSELIVYFLWVYGIVSPRPEYAAFTGDRPPPADPARANLRSDQLQNIET